MVEGARLFSAQQHRQRAAGCLDVLLDVAGVVRHHDEAHADDRGRGPKERHERERARKHLVACQRNKTAHNDAAHRLADGKVGERRLASGVHHDDDGSDKRDDEGSGTCLPNNVQAEQEGHGQKADGQPEGRARIDVVVDEHRVGGLHVVLGRIGSLDEVEVVVEGVHGRLHEDADEEQKPRHAHVQRPGVGQGAGGGHEHGHDGRRPGMGRGQLKSEARGEGSRRSPAVRFRMGTHVRFLFSS